MKTAFTKDYWREFQNKNPMYNSIPFPPCYYFCDNEKDANDCAELVQKGIKRATTHALSSLQLHNEELPSVDDIAIITDWYGNPKAIIKTVKVAIVQFKDITAEYEYIEGEGDKSLAYWKQVHWDYYLRELSDHGIQPTPAMELVCEQFETIWPLKK
ncbi:ASCH domain-containing protein [Sphingobacterium deserti]|uniref:ASCH domain-containing protein n=1 Tax=Sphingobacterium deserti TaxID=1229276 RepID=A0A0B8T5S9_9SPHI|nr:ASCH domain-containing protein [Sphingobacterium deserti]KGE13104.1 ASCH domain-containing protein [Sphingobacterium deserti]